MQRDLLDEPERLWSAERARVAEEGWGARLLAQRGSDGRWAKGLYNPKYTSTTYTLLELRRFGLPRAHRAAVESTDLLLQRQVWMLGPRSAYWEACAAGFGLCLASYFAADETRREALLSALLAAQMPDGGWNCQRPRGATRRTVRSTPPSTYSKACAITSRPVAFADARPKPPKSAAASSFAHINSTARTAPVGSSTAS